MRERSGRFGKFGFLADQAKFPRSHGSRASTIGRLSQPVADDRAATSLNEAMDQFAPAVGPNTVILPILDRVSARFGAEHVLGGMANISAAVDAEGRVVQFFPNHDLVFGEVSGGFSDRTTSQSCQTWNSARREI
jgi:hypothetical protein